MLMIEGNNNSAGGTQLQRDDANRQYENESFGK